MAASTQPTRDARAKRGQGLIALVRERLRGSSGGRALTVVGVLLIAGFAVAILILRGADGGDAPLEGLVATAGRWSAWLLGAPVALAAAQDHVVKDRRDGVDALAGGRGFSTDALGRARIFAAMLQATAAIGLPLVALSLVTAAVAESLRIALARLVLAMWAAAFALLSGVTLGGIGALCGQVGRARGRLLFLAVVAVPWVLGDLTGNRSASIPGALGAALDFALGGAGA